MIKKTIFLSILFFTTLPLVAQTPSEYAGTASSIFLRSGLSARVSAMGESFTAIADDENALFYNPAGLVNIKQGAVGLNHTEWFEDIRMDNIVFGYNFDKSLGVGLSVAHMWMPSIQGKDNFGNPTGDINVSSSIINLGLGYRIHPSLFLGIGVKYFNDDLAGFSASSIALDAGLFMYTQITGLTFGVAVQNVGGKIQYDSEKEKIPLSYRVGFAYKLPGTGLRVAIDGVKSIDSDISLAAGIEYTLLKTFSMRFGNHFKPDQKFAPGYGVGLNIGSQYAIDYTYYAFEDLGNTHRVGFTFRFDLSDNKPGVGNSYKSYKITRSRAPSNITCNIKENRLIISWGKVYGAVYNVYAKTSKGGAWKKLNSRLIRGNSLEFKEPSNSSKTIYIAVTSVTNSVESAFSKEVLVNVK